MTEMSESGVAKPTNLENKGDEKNGKLVCSAGLYRKRRSNESYVPENDLTRTFEKMLYPIQRTNEKI